ncbi:hypothetical protein MATL_G00243850 [Megalops atlanticus]|uniref:Sushi domain-containing protein n=1 Tax=Megalops atlanticus TaxID=7932 RepID=A0A9D3PG39_MEGAT|nr:hypothetical protein MATL_G00243850 [Megalops atlanticus]
MQWEILLKSSCLLSLPPSCALPSVQAPQNGNVTCADSSGDLLYGSRCSFSCDPGFILHGYEVTTCGKSGNWIGERPVCQAVRCPSVQAPQNGNVTCADSSGDLLYGSRCSFSCDPGFILHGYEVTTCGKSGNWIGERPVCQAVRCPSVQAPQNGNVTCADSSGDLLYGSRCSFSCDPGFILRGYEVTTCGKSGNWIGERPVCQAVRCPSVQAPQNGNVTCADSSGDLLYGSRCSFSCDPGFILHGYEVTTCGKSGNWIGERPVCQAVRCPSVQAPQNGNVTCADSSGDLLYGSRCSFSCDPGFILRGYEVTTCGKSGNWIGERPVCQAVRCPSVQAPQNGNVTCADSSGDLLYGSRCSFSCDPGFILHGYEVTTCGKSGNWIGERPVCQAHPDPTLNPTSVVLATGGAAGLTCLFLAVWIVKRLKQKAKQFDVNSSIEDGTPPEVYKNSTESLI